tara:strand:+ start:319 stop:984 length:666 start_codon:yes stop_codon:yes gene_type:complete
MDNNDFNIKVTVRNGRLLKAIRKTYKSVAELARNMGRSSTAVNSLVGLKTKPFNEKGWTNLAQDVAAMVGKDPEELWPEHLKELKLHKSSAEIALGLDGVKQLIQDGSSEKTLSQLSSIADFSKRLTLRERQIVTMRFALGHTLEEIARVFGITRNRCMQIEAKALKKMRRAAEITGHVDVDRNRWRTVYCGETEALYEMRLSEAPEIITLKQKGSDLLED